MVKLWFSRFCKTYTLKCDLQSINCIIYTDENATAASCQIYRFVATCQRFATNLTVSSSCNKSVKIKLVATCYLQTLLQLVETTWCKPVEKKVLEINLQTSLLTTCNRHMSPTNIWCGLVGSKSVTRCQQTGKNLHTNKAYRYFCSPWQRLGTLKTHHDQM